MSHFTWAVHHTLELLLDSLRFVFVNVYGYISINKPLAHEFLSSQSLHHDRFTSQLGGLI